MSDPRFYKLLINVHFKRLSDSLTARLDTAMGATTNCPRFGLKVLV